MTVISARPARGRHRRSLEQIITAGSAGPPLGLAALFCAVVFVFPSEVVVVGPLRSNGSPARLLGFMALALVTLGLIRAQAPEARHQRRRADPVVVALLLYLAASVFTYAIGLGRISTAQYSATSLRYLLLIAAGTGVALLIATACQSTGQARVLVGWLVAGSALNALVGLAQALGARFSWADLVRVPGFTYTSNPGVFRERLDFVRVLGTTSHPIEFAVCLAVTLPLALHMARFGRTQASRLGGASAAVLIALATPFALSRTGLLCIVVALAVYLPLADRGQRWAVAAGLVLAPAVAVLAAPRIVTAFGDLFRGVSLDAADADASVSGRLDDYEAVGELFARHPWLGGTLTGGDGVLDNQWLGFLVRGGLVAVVAFMLLLVVPCVRSIQGARGEPRDAERSSLAGAVIGGLAASAIAAFAFDTLAFQQSAMLVFVLTGLASVVGRAKRGRRLRPPEPPTRPVPVGESTVPYRRPPVPRPSPRPMNGRRQLHRPVL